MQIVQSHGYVIVYRLYIETYKVGKYNTPAHMLKFRHNSGGEQATAQMNTSLETRKFQVNVLMCVKVNIVNIKRARLKNYPIYLTRYKCITNSYNKT
jgi:hypothetical protein